MSSKSKNRSSNCPVSTAQSQPTPPAHQPAPAQSESAQPLSAPLAQPMPVLDNDRVKERLHAAVDDALVFCQSDQEGTQSFASFEQKLKPHVNVIGLILMQAYLVNRNQRLDLEPYLENGKYRVVDRHAKRTLSSAYGELTYERAYLAPRKKNADVKHKLIGFHPLDMILGLTRDKFTPFVIQLLACLATRMSFGASRMVCQMLLRWAPSQESIEQAVLGMGRRAAAFVQQLPAPIDDGEVLIIEIDCKCVPTATEEELKKRKKSCKNRKCKNGKKCKCCQRHRGKARRKARGPKKRRERGDKSKNGKQAMLVVMYTLKRGDDRKLHGPINKKTWGTFAGRPEALKWAQEQAEKRGFGPTSDKTIQVVMDGDKNFRRLVREYFPQALMTLDIYHVIERLWELGRHYHSEGSEELTKLVDSWKELLYAGKVNKLVDIFKRLLKQTPLNGPGTKGRRKCLSKQINYLEPRLEMMNYAELRRKDLVIGSGQVEGGVRHVIGLRMDSASMRWVREKAEAMLQLRCILINGDWEAFAEWHAEESWRELQQRGRVKILTEEGMKLPLEEPPKKKKKKKKARKSPSKRKAA